VPQDQQQDQQQDEHHDGRVARRDRNRVAVLDAVIELFADGDLEPSPEAVARRVGLSLRSVYRYFDDRDALIRAAIDRQVEQVMPLFVIPAIGRGPLDERVERFVACRLRLYEQVAAAARATRARAATDEIVRRQLEVTRRALRDQIERHFAPELDALADRGGARLAAIDALCSFEALDHYRAHRGFSPGETHGLLVDALHALLVP
jgi:AcrR family transcriptional regulator